MNFSKILEQKNTAPGAHVEDAALKAPEELLNEVIAEVGEHRMVEDAVSERLDDLDKRYPVVVKELQRFEPFQILTPSQQLEVLNDAEQDKFKQWEKKFGITLLKSE